MATPIEMPKLGNTVEECLITGWRKRPGDRVAEGDVLAEVETDKATFDVTSSSSGVLLATFFDDGALVPVFTTLAVVGAEGEDVEAFRPSGTGEPGPSGSIAAPVPVPVAQAVPIAQAVPVAQAVPIAQAVPDAPWSPRARRFARERDLPQQDVLGSGPGGRVLEADVKARWFSGPRVSPPARDRLNQGWTAPTRGTGLGGAIRGDDVQPAADQPADVQPAAAASVQPSPGAADAAVPLSTMRARIAQRLRESLATTAQYTLHTSARAGQLLTVRRRLKADPSTAGITVNDLLMYCTVRALLAVPALNAEFVGGAVRTHEAVHLGFACDTERGLVVPVIRDAQNLSLRGLATRSAELAAAAVAGTLGVDDLTGGTFTVSNLGSLGIESFTPVLNPPQVAILGVNAVGLKAVRNADGNVEFVDTVGLSLTLDHQVIDGAPGARFLRVLRVIVEEAGTTCSI